MSSESPKLNNLRIRLPKEMRTSIASLEVEITQLKSQLNKLKSKTSENNSEIKNLTSKISAKELLIEMI